MYARALCPVLASLSLLVAGFTGQAAASCRACHEDMVGMPEGGHAMLQDDCSACHGGDPDATRLPLAHEGLIAFPGNLDNAAATCGTCHPQQVESVSASPMHTGTHMVRITRRAFGQSPSDDRQPTLQALSNTPADSLLRKLCASCHLGQEKTHHALDVTRDRGGGCLACHVNDYPVGRHPALTARVGDGRCFGCHSRSSRIALSYAGLAETDAAPTASPDRQRARLQDGRLVEHRPADAHHRAGMSCIDCHTGAGLMGALPAAQRQDQAVDIACSDCHDNRRARITPDAWPDEYRGMLDRIRFPVSAKQEFLATANGTPLWHIEVRGERLVLHPKLGGIERPIPRYRLQDHPRQAEHARLTCDACHARWAPQCHACHLHYSPGESQWDHIEGEMTPGRWSQRQAGIRNDLPPLGVTAAGRITAFVPGMIMTVEHPDIGEPLFRRLFGALSPHTTGRARSCTSCHASPVALGLGEGTLVQRGAVWTFAPTHPPLADGLPADAWTKLRAERPGSGTYPQDRSFSNGEIQRILNNWHTARP